MRSIMSSLRLLDIAPALLDCQLLHAGANALLNLAEVFKLPPLVGMRYAKGGGRAGGREGDRVCERAGRWERARGSMDARASGSASGRVVGVG